MLRGYRDKMQSAKQKAPSDDEVLKKLCVANGLSYDTIVTEGGNITVLEMFFSGFPRMVGLSLFPRLCQLTIVDQKITRIQGLEHCPLLKELWVVQCHLTEICGLQNSLQLEKLYLYHNQISEIKNLELLFNLQILWLNNNCITKIEGLDRLKNLKVLNLADNFIEKIEDSLHPNESLLELNLSGNKISSFKELTHLAHLPNLVDLALQDRTSVPNPVCLLQNYGTHVVYHVPGLQRLDDYDVSRKLDKESAESAVLKKKMYYNMRVRTAQRNLAEIQLSLIEKKKTLSQLPEERIKTLSQTLKSLEHELSMMSRSCKKSASILEVNPKGPLQPAEGFAKTSDSPSDTIQDSASEPAILLKTEALRERLNVWTRRLDEIEACYESDLAQATNRMEYTVQFLLMELESVGNIRLEEGNSTDLWFTSCRDLLLSRFAPSDYKVHGIVDLKINRVIRINNNALRVRFEERLHGLIADDNTPFSQKNYRQQLDYLFYIPDPERCEKEETLRIVEEGFKTDPLKALGGKAAIPLSNSLSVIEQPRIENALKQASRSDKKKGVETIPFRHGQTIVSKVFVGNSSPLRDGEPLDRRSHSRAFSVCRRLNTQPRSTSKAGPGSTKTHECNLYKTQWFMFDHELILPEYIIYFEYITTDKGPSLLNLSTDRETSSSDIILDEEVLNMEPVLKPWAKRLSLDNEFLLTVARANLLSQITVLNLHSNSLSRIKEIASLRALQHLTLSFNRLTRLDDISHMPNLEFLDVSFNELLTLEGLQGLGQLKQLDLRWNQLTKAREDTSVLQKHTPALLKLDTRYNPWNRPQSIRMTILGQLPALTHLDEELVSEEEAAEAVRTAAGSKINQATLQVHSRSDSERPRSLSLLSTAQLVCQLRPSPCCLCSELEPGWTEKVTTLNLDNMRITQMISLSELVNLRWASFNDNEISNVQGLDSCVKLEELSLNNNSISTLNGLMRLHCLSKLSMDGNLFSSLDASVLDQLPNLSFLSLEKNCIISLSGIQRLRSLRELYIGSNQISTSTDIFYLKGLDHLIILDLYGNPLVEKRENYRIYVVFHLPSLKALDGVAVKSKERKNAEKIFRGRLSTDTIAEKLGHSKYTTITHLTLQSCSIRTVDLSPVDLFNNLRSVNLDHNNLTSFSGLVSLRNVKTLSLNYNTIESILPMWKTQAHLTKSQKLYNKVQSSGYGQQSASRVNRGPTGSLEPLMNSLEVLHLSHNGISNMANLQLSRFTNLKALFLQGNEISQVEGLQGLGQLRELVLNQNRIKVLAKNSFTAQRLLIELSLMENRIRELNHLDSLTELRRLFLDMNKLQDIAELKKLKVLPLLAELSVVGNPVAQNSLHRPAVVRDLSKLQVLDHVVVTLEERTMAELPPKDQSPCLQSHGASLPLTEKTLCGLLPFPSYRTSLCVSGGQQKSFQTNMGKKPHCSTVVRGSQIDITSRDSRRTGGNVPTSGLLSDGNRVTFTHCKQEQASRRPSDGRPPPM